MAAKIIGNSISLLVLVYITLLITFYFMHITVVGEVNDINYNIIETIAITGNFKEDMYDYLKRRLEKYGEFSVTLKYEKLIDDGEFDIFFSEDEIIDKDFNIGDRLTIFISANKKDLYQIFLNAGIFSSVNNNIDLSIKSLKTAVISKDSKGS